ncbi:carboxylesterase family protein [Saccharicrinis sp. FJH54]|uniref:carboxylesterase family protein n=1 Tax=Saccharicrinis sp. FJH54 TaxID=3344665 RepID=UPI0035D4BDED
MRLKSIIFFIFILFVYSNCLRSQVVTTAYGPVSGNKSDNVFEFLGIPFASPPVDELRWRAPVPPENHTDTLRAMHYPPACPQKNFEQGDTTATIMGDEDCLYLNVWSPDLSGGLPVMVFIHGGGNQQGSTGQETGGTKLYDGKNLSERGDVVVVTIQYRLGILGYMVHPGLEAENTAGISGNYGVLDQILALHWIQNNIAAFGGDPTNVTLFGESAGGVNTGNLLLTDEAGDLFHKAIIQSAIPGLEDYAEATEKSTNLVNSFVSSGTDEEKIAAMRKIPADSLSETLNIPINGGIVQQSWRPVIDDVLFTDNPESIIQSGRFNHMPLIIGSNSDEMSLSAPLVVYPSMVNALVSLYLPAIFRPEALSLYPPGSTQDEARNAYVQILTDAQFTASVRRTAQCIELNQAEPVWRYFFTYTHSVAQLASFGSYHGMELFYVFNNWENATLGSSFLFKPQDDSMQYNMLHYWTNFARTGNPNTNGLTTWPEYAASEDCYLEIKATPNGSQCGVRSEKSDFWDKVINFKGCTSFLSKNEIDAINGFRVYPNPTNDAVKLEHNEPIEFNAALYGSNGDKLASYHNISKIDLSDYANGMYILKVTTRGQHKVYKVTKIP